MRIRLKNAFTFFYVMNTNIFAFTLTLSKNGYIKLQAKIKIYIDNNLRSAVLDSIYAILYSQRYYRYKIQF